MLNIIYNVVMVCTTTLVSEIATGHTMSLVNNALYANCNKNIIVINLCKYLGRNLYCDDLEFVA